MPYSAKVCSRVFTANNETRGASEDREKKRFKLGANSNSSSGSLLQIHSRLGLGSGPYPLHSLWRNVELAAAVVAVPLPALINAGHPCRRNEQESRAWRLYIWPLSNLKG